MSKGKFPRVFYAELRRKGARTLEKEGWLLVVSPGSPGTFLCRPEELMFVSEKSYSAEELPGLDLERVFREVHAMYMASRGALS